MGQDDNSRDSGKQAIENRQKQDNDDFNNAMSDRDTGQQRYFGFEKNASQKKARKEQQKRALQRALLLNTRYAKLYQETFQKLNEAENAVYDAQVKGAALVNEAQNSLDQTLEKASTTEDGTAVFRSEDGSVYTQDGQLLKGDELDGITWRDDAPSWEEYQKLQRDLQEKQQYFDRMNAHEQHLGELRTEMEDKDNPPTEERLEEIQKDIESTLKDVRNDNDIQTEFKVQKLPPASLPDLGL